jgi:ribosomal protein RSM22 (predicted rRNA methylase)
VLPPAIRAALGELSEGRGRADLALRSQTISQTYHGRRNSAEALLTDADALAYAMARMPATHAAATEALERLAAADPGFAPRSLLDVGCGPGTASFAAAEVFPSLQLFTLLDRNGPFLALARRLAPAALPGRELRIETADLAAGGPLPRADLVVACYVLAELPGPLRRDLVRRLWTVADQALLLVEPGTPDGFERLQAPRADLLAAGAHVAAPCTHGSACPMTGGRWCRFVTRVQRSRDHRLLKRGERPFEDEPFSYLALVRAGAARPPARRIVGRPAAMKAGVTLELCGPDGLTLESVPSRNRDRHKAIKDLRWGDAVESQA